jgi:hypothetical protein
MLISPLAPAPNRPGPFSSGSEFQSPSLSGKYLSLMIQKSVLPPARDGQLFHPLISSAFGHRRAAFDPRQSQLLLYLLQVR